MFKINENIAVIIAPLAFLFGSMDGLLIALLCLTAVDVITGWSKAIIKHKLNSSTSYKGLIKKFMMYLIIGVANVLDTQVLNNNGLLRNCIVLYFVATEGLSIIENVGTCGVKLPKKLVDALEQLKKEGE